MGNGPEKKPPAVVIIYEDDHHEADGTSKGVVVHRDETGKLSYTPPAEAPNTDSEKQDTTTQE